MNIVYLSIGSNLGNRRKYLDSALELLQSKGLHVLSVSGIYETEAWGLINQPKFLNMAVKAETSMEPQEVLDVIQQIEDRCGRKRGDIRNSSRTLDIDILFFNANIEVSDNLMIPHPLIHQRMFVLIPLSEIAADFRHPVLGKSITELIARCEDQGEVVRLS